MGKKIEAKDWMGHLERLYSDFAKQGIGREVVLYARKDRG
jgi:hypothetical protein|tara:strand:- start:744 stop:863 length:120 start_codon:yes stop_codon:yes gene_type:complete